MQPIPEWPALNPWTRPVRLRNGQLRLMSASRTRIDLSPSDSADVSAACELLACRWPLTKIRNGEASNRGILILARLGQLVDARILQSNAGPEHESDLGRALMQAALSNDPKPQPTIHAPTPLPPSVGVVAPPQWQPLITRAFNNAGIDQVTSLTVDRCLSPRSSPYLEGITLVVIVGELNWSMVAQLMDAGLAHLLITPSAVAVEIGPLVYPGVSPCLRCLHLAKRSVDPHWSTTTEAIQDREQPPIDPVLAQNSAQLSAALSCSVIVDHSTESSVVLRTSAPYGETSVTRVTMHPLCDCHRDLEQIGLPDSGLQVRAA